MSNIDRIRRAGPGRGRLADGRLTYSDPIMLRLWRPPFDLHLNAGGCSDDCAECSRQYRPTPEQQLDSRSYTNELDDGTAKELLRLLVAEARGDLDYLRTRLAVSVDKALKRWTKLTQDGKIAVLKKALPDIYPKSHHKHTSHTARTAKMASYGSEATATPISCRTSTWRTSSMTSQSCQACFTTA